MTPRGLLDERAAQVRGVRQATSVDLTDLTGSDVLTSIRFRSTVPRTWLDVGAEVDVRSVEVNGFSIEPSVADGRLALECALGENVVTIASRSGYADTEGLVRRRRGVFTQFQPEGMRNLHPCFDTPAIKASYEWTVQVPQGWTVVGPTLPAAEGAAAGTRWRFAATHSLPSYASGFAAGQWASSTAETRSMDGRTLRVGAHVEVDSAEAAALEGVVALAGQAIAWLERWLTVPFPMATWDHVFVDDHPSGAVETAGCPTFDAGLLGPGARSRLEELVVHELVHAWFGNLLTPAGWTELWFSEGLATYVTLRCLEGIRPESQHVAVFDFTTRTRCADQGVEPFTHPVRPATALADPRDAFDDISYNGSALLFHAWERGWPDGGLRRALASALTSSCDHVDAPGWAAVVGAEVSPRAQEAVQTDLARPWTRELAAASPGFGEEHPLAVMHDLGSSWIEAATGRRSLRSVIDRTAEVVASGVLTDDLVGVVLDHALPRLQLGAHYREIARGRGRIVTALFEAVSHRPSDRLVHELVRFSREADAAGVAGVVEELGRDCCHRAWAYRSRTWGARRPGESEPHWSINTREQKRAEWARLGGPGSFDVRRVDQAARALRQLDHETVLDFLGDAYVSEIPAVAARLSRLEARYVLTALYPWSSHPARLIRIAHAQLAGAEPAVAPYLRWIVAEASIHRSICEELSA